MQQLQSQLTAAVLRRDKLREHLRAARTACDIATKDRQAHLLDGDLADRKAASALQARVGETESTVSGIEAALTVLEGNIDGIEQKIQDERARLERKAAAAALANYVAAVEKIIEPCLESMRALAGAVERLGPYEPVAVASFLHRTSGEVETAVSMLLVDAARSIPAIEIGTLPIPQKVAAIASSSDEG